MKNQDDQLNINRSAGFFPQPAPLPGTALRCLPRAKGGEGVHKALLCAWRGWAHQWARAENIEETRRTPTSHRSSLTAAVRH